MIRVDKDAKEVSITGNTTHKTPEAVESSTTTGSPTTTSRRAGRSRTTRSSPLGTDSGSSGGCAAAAASQPVGAAGGDGDGNGKADDFRFNGDDIDGTGDVSPSPTSTSARATASCCRTSTRGTFLDFAGDNEVVVNAEKTYVRIDSLTDIQEIVTASQGRERELPDTNDTLVLRIAQDDGTAQHRAAGLRRRLQVDLRRQPVLTKRRPERPAREMRLSRASHATLFRRNYR